MTSARKIAANRANSQLSTGPKSRKGKSRSAQNARRHGLSLSVLLSPSLSKEVEKLAQQIAGDGGDYEVLEAARQFAEAQVDLDRISRFRHDYLSRSLENFESPAGTSNSMLSEMGPGDELRSLQLSEPTRRHVLQQLLKIDRYEQRALSRRKFAAHMLNISLKAAKRRNDREIPL